MQSGFQNCCRQCCSQCKQVQPRNLQIKLAPPSTNQERNTKFFRCPNDNKGSGQNDKVILVCCKECVIGDAADCNPTEFKPCPPPTCDCCACKKCPLRLLKRVCKRAWEALERQKHCQERYPLFDGGRILSYEQYPSRRSDEYARKRYQSGYRRDPYGKSSTGNGYEDRSQRRKRSYEGGVRDKKGKQRRRANDSDGDDRGRKKKDSSNRGRCDSYCKGRSKDTKIPGRQDTESDDDVRGRKRRKSRRIVSEDRLDERNDKRSKKNKRSKSKDCYESDGEDDTQIRNNIRDKSKNKGEKVGKARDGMDVEEGRKRKDKGKQGADSSHDDSNIVRNKNKNKDEKVGKSKDGLDVVGDGKRKSKGNRPSNNLDDGVDGMRGRYTDKSSFSARTGQDNHNNMFINRGKSGPGRISATDRFLRRGNNAISARVGQLGPVGRPGRSPGPTRNGFNTDTLEKSVPPADKLSKRHRGSGRLQEIGISDVMRVRLEVLDLRRRGMNRPQKFCPCQPCTSYRCLRNVCTFRPVTCPVPCIANTNHCCSTRCCL